MITDVKRERVAMTREEAITIMQLYKDELEHRIAKIDYDIREIDLYSIHLDAFEVAIEALSAEAVHKPDYSYEADMVRRLKESLSAEAVQGWIPVEEQPPVFPCLVCDANGNQPSVPLGIVTITDEEHGEWHIDGRLWDTKIFFKGEWCSQTGYGNRILAWMPLPKPYKGGDDE